jgi:uncharacterized BrkB/YihY/UPF0761 family membrane protein
MKNVITLIGMIALIAIVVVAGPLLLIWAINEFGQFLWPERQLPYTVWTWLAALILGATVSTTKVKR